MTKERINIELKYLHIMESHLAKRVAKGKPENLKGLTHDFIQLYRTRAKIVELRHERGDEECLTN